MDEARPEEPNTAAGLLYDPRLYAAVLFSGTWAGVAVLAVTFTLYVGGFVEPAAPLEETTANWHRPVDEYQQATGLQKPIKGWRWLAHLDRGEYLAMIGLAILAGITIVCYFTLLPALAKKRDFIYLALAALQIIVLVAAASGIVSG